jgi:hypothetical protein
MEFGFSAPRNFQAPVTRLQHTDCESRQLAVSSLAILVER